MGGVPEHVGADLKLASDPDWTQVGPQAERDDLVARGGAGVVTTADGQVADPLLLVAQQRPVSPLSEEVGAEGDWKIVDVARRDADGGVPIGPENPAIWPAVAAGDTLPCAQNVEAFADLDCQIR